MGNINDLLNVGNGILTDVTRAIETGNYDGLGERTRERVNFGITQFSSAPDASTQNRMTGGRTQPTGAGPAVQNRAAAQQQTAANRQTAYSAAGTRPVQRTAPAGYRPNVYPRRQTGGSHFLSDRKHSNGWPQIIAGGLGAFVGTLGSLCSFGIAGAFSSSAGGALAAGFGMAAAGTGIIFAALFFISLGLIHSGVKMRKLVRKYYEYGTVIGDQEYFDIRHLAEKLGTNWKEVSRNIEKMMRKNLLPPSTKMDRKKETVMLTDEAYQLYQQAEASRVEREARQQMRGEVPFTETEHMDADVRRIIEDGNRAIIQVRAINDEIPDTQVMSDKLYRLEEIMKRIFEQVQKDPSSAPDLRRFMNYYLPTTTKLLTAYVEMDRQPVQGDTIKKTKAEIEASLDTINDAFEQLLDGMFSDMAMDITSDISVMKTMMAQDGLSAEGNPLFDGTGELKFQ